MKINISIDEDVHTKAKVIAVLRGMTLNDYLIEAIGKHVNKKKRSLENL